MDADGVTEARVLADGAHEEAPPLEADDVTDVLADDDAHEEAPPTEADAVLLLDAPESPESALENGSEAPEAAAGSEPSADRNDKPVNIDGTISARAADVRTYQGLPPHGLDDEQIEKLFGAIDEMRRVSRGCDYSLFGWRLVYTLRRAPGSSTRGDIMVVDPRDGQKIFSTLGLKRKLGFALQTKHTRPLTASKCTHRHLTSGLCHPARERPR